MFITTEDISKKLFPSMIQSSSYLAIKLKKMTVNY